MQPPDKGGKEVYIFGPGHMIKMVVMPIHVYGKNKKKNSSPEPLGGLP